MNISNLYESYQIELLPKIYISNKIILMFNRTPNQLFYYIPEYFKQL